MDLYDNKTGRQLIIEWQWESAGSSRSPYLLFSLQDEWGQKFYSAICLSPPVGVNFLTDFQRGYATVERKNESPHYGDDSISYDGKGCFIIRRNGRTYHRFHMDNNQFTVDGATIALIKSAPIEAQTTPQPDATPSAESVASNRFGECSRPIAGAPAYAELPPFPLD